MTDSDVVRRLRFLFPGYSWYATEGMTGFYKLTVWKNHCQSSIEVGKDIQKSDLQFAGDRLISKLEAQ